MQARKILYAVCLLLPTGISFVLAGVPAASAGIEARTATEVAGGDEIWLPLVSNESPEGIFISSAEIAALPNWGSAWQNVLGWAQEDASSPDLSDPKDDTDAVVMAKALVFLRTGNANYRLQAAEAVMNAIGTEDGSDEVLPLARNLTAYIIAAELIRLDPEDDGPFRAWLHAVRYEEFDDFSLISAHEERPNNWGTHAGAARIAAALYLGDWADLERAATVFHGYLGNRAVYAGFNFGSDLSWQCDPSHPVGINPATCLKDGHSVDGVMPDDQRRGGPFEWPPPKENYAWEALQGIVAQARMLQRVGYPAFSWQNQAIARAVSWLYLHAQFPATGDDSAIPWLINSVYITDFPVELPTRPGKNGLGFYDWFTAN